MAHLPASARIYTRATGYRHFFRRGAARILNDLLLREGWKVLITEDPHELVRGPVRRPTVFVFLNTSGTVLPLESRDALREAVVSGAGFAGIHSAADTEHEWEWYGTLIGTKFRHHPPMQTARVTRTAGDHPSTSHLPDSFSHRDEWYNFAHLPPPAMRTLLSVDESTYRGGSMGAVHPVCWCAGVEHGRMWYTALGHRRATFSEGWFQQHCVGGIRWAGGE